MNIEYLQIISMTLGGLLFAAGGTGFKVARRFILPLLLGGVALYSKFEWWRVLGMVVCLTASLILPYGERTPYLGKFLVACAWSASTLWLGFSWWQVVTPFIFIGMFALSNINKTAAIFSWKIVEFITGSLIGIIVANLLQKTRKEKQ